MKIASSAAAVIITVAALLSGTPSAGQHHQARYPCGKPIVSRHRESLLQFVTIPGLGQSIRERRTEAGRELSVIAHCDGLVPGTWTPRIAKLMRGDYGKDIFTSRMPAGTRFWPLCDACD